MSDPPYESPLLEARQEPAGVGPALFICLLLAAIAGGALVVVFCPALPSIYEGRLDVNVTQVAPPAPGPDEPDDPDDDRVRSPYPEISRCVPDWVRGVDGEPNYVRGEARQLARIFADAARNPVDRAELLDDLQRGIDAEFDQPRQDAWESFNVAFSDAAAEWSRGGSDRQARSDREWADLVLAVAIGLEEVSR